MQEDGNIGIFARTGAQKSYWLTVVALLPEPLKTVLQSSGLVLCQTADSLEIKGANQGTVYSVRLPAKAADIVALLAKAIHQEQSAPITMAIQDCTLETRNYLWQRADEPQIRLTEKETALLAFLYHAGGAVVSREALLDEVWAYAQGVETHTLETHIYRLRQKIERNPSTPEILLTDGEGYRLQI